MGNQQLVEDLVVAGYQDAHTTDAQGAQFVVFSYPVPIGAHAGETVQVGLQAQDWPVNPPGGPHVSPRIQHPGDNAHHGSPLGDAWIYWSRPHPGWAATDRSVEEYLTHLRTLFAQFHLAAS